MCGSTVSVVLLAAVLAGSSGCSEQRAGIVVPTASAVVAVPRPPASARGQGTSLPRSASSAAPVASASEAPLAASQAAGCDIAIEALLEANVYRGSPSSPMKWESYRQNPRYARMAEGIDHGARYLSCKWRVRVNGVHYRYERSSHEGPESGELRAELCSGRAEAEATATDIARFTDQCQDLHRGEYYGDVLSPESSSSERASP